MDRLLEDVANAYERDIVAVGRAAHFWMLVAFLASFGFIRSSAHMIRAQVSWWPGNVETKGGTHIHHMVWGILLLLVFGYVGIAVAPGSPWRELVAVLFGIGMGLTLDEFALWLNLQDVYWEAKGRQSIDAVLLASALLSVTLLGVAFWIDVARAMLIFLGIGARSVDEGESTALLLAGLAVGACLAVVAVLKGKLLVGVVGLFIPLVGLFGAVRLARPGSRWARRWYPQEKLARSRARFAGTDGA